MNSIKAESKSRRSSILKPPKSRQPLQNVELNTSSAENSPATSTTKVKRRVSFAEKKHVKEFCDSMEQGTVWDNTYEESELSQRNSQNSNSDENNVTAELTNQLTKHQTQVNVISKTISETVVRESIVTVVESRSSTLVYKETTKIAEEKNSKVVVSEEPPTRIPLPTNHIGSFKARRSLAVCEAFAGKDDINETKPQTRARADSCSAQIDSAPLKIVRQSLPNLAHPIVTAEKCNDVFPVDKNIISDASAGLPLPVSMAESAVKDCAVRHSLIAMTPNAISVEKSVRNSINPVPDHLILPDINLVVNDDPVDKVPNMELEPTEPEKIVVFHDTSMDMTEAISHLPKLNNPAQSMITASKEEALAVPTESTTLQMQNMEITEAVSNIVSQKKSLFSEFDLKEPVFEPRKSIFHDKSMDFTEIIPGTLSVERLEEPPPEKTTIFHNKSVDFTEIIRNMPNMDEPPKLPSEQTTIVHDRSMDITNAVASIPIMKQLQKSPGERTTIFHDNVVDFTEVVPNVPCVEKPRDPPPERTSIFHNKSLDFTEVVPNVPYVEKPQEPRLESSTIFHNNSVDFTEAVLTIPRLQKLQELPPESSTIFHNKSVDITEVVPSVPLVQKPRESPLATATLIHNESLDFTEAVPAFQAVQKPPNVEEKPVRPSIFRNLSADLIGKVASAEKLQCDKNQKENRDILQNFHASDLAEAMARISRATKPLIKISSRPIEKKVSTDAKPLIPSPQKPSCADAEPEIHSPLPKRLKPLGHETIDVTAALPFIAMRRAKKQGRKTSCDDESLESPNVSPRLSIFESIAEIQRKPEEVNNLFTEQTERFENQSMEETEIAPRSFACKAISGGIVPMSVPEEIAVFQNRLTRTLNPLSAFVDPNNDDSLQQLQNKTINQDESMDITCSIQSIIPVRQIEVEGNPPNANLQDQSMEMTVAISHPPPMGKFDLPGYGDTKTMVFRDNSMELTEAVQYSSDANKQLSRNYEDHGKGQSNSVPKFGNEGRTVVFRDDCMELTGAVPFNSRDQPPFMDKENCPQAIENLRPPRAQIFAEKSRIKETGSRNEWLDLTKSVPFLSSQKNKENRIAQEDLDDQSRFNHMGSDEITGVVPFASQNDEERADDNDTENYRKNSRSLVFGNQEMELDVYSSAEKNPYRSSQVAKGLFQQRPPSAEFSGEKGKAVDTNERRKTADLQAEVRQLAEDFALENESGFDQATFLRQQAQCMEDYEANSTASQDCNSASQLTRTNGTLSTITESQEPAKSNDAKMIGNEQTSTNADWEVSRVRAPDASTLENRDVSVLESHGVSSKSLEELRCRAYSVSKYQPDLIGNSDNFHETIMLEDLQAVEPPSFALEDSVTKDCPEIVQCALSTHGLPTDSEIRRNNIDGELYEEGDETISQMIENVSQVEIPEITMTQTVNMLKVEERMERKKMNHSQTYVLKKPISNATIFSTSSTETGQETAENERRSNTGVTTAADFSSESPNGPCEKLRRTESPLPIEGIEELPTKFANAGRFGGRKSFANSTVIGDDTTRRLMERELEEPSVVLECSVLPNELPSAIETNEEQNVSKSVLVEEVANDITMKAEISVHKSPFDICKENIEELAGSLETIWTINRLDKKVLAVNFFSNSIVLAIYLNEDEDTSTYPIKVVLCLSQLVEEDTDPGVALAHSLIMKKVDSASLTRSYRTYEDIPQLLDFVSTEVKLGMDFMFELDRLRNQNVMEILGNRVVFMIRTSDINAGIILNVSMEIKPFEEIRCDDITISYILGREKVRENDIKNLITNVKRDHRFLRYYMNDVKDYVDVMAETGFSTINATACN